ncbi:hypothetical protein DFJ77DRAFT_446879 [Powellomyces hirtus]|nr:hypothetical protein DFJ77DRAFT_446879 [Powellomyces hirtus]
MRLTAGSVALALLVAAPFAAAQLGPNYKCDPATCKLPACYCASTQPPVANPPQFLMLTYDDSIQAAVWPQAQALLNRKNPNGCPVKATWYTQVLYSDPYLVSQWYAQGNEVADHSVTHAPIFAGTYAEVEGMRKWANEYAGIPLGKIKGFRFPYLNYTTDAIAMLAKMGFEYESSMASGTGDMVWPYTLDYGTVNDCLGTAPACGKELNAKGLWEVPMYSTTGPNGIAQLMDPYNLPTLDAPQSPEQVTANYRTTFDAHYAASRVPFGVYLHPTWIGKSVPVGTAANPTATQDGTPKAAAVAAFLDYAMSKPDTWMVTASQMVEYMKNPVPASQLAAQPYMSCTPNPAPPNTICNGLAGDAAAGNAAPETCNLVSGSFRSCYGCPAEAPTLENPSPPTTSTRKRVPTTCDSLWWDPVAGTCLCTADSCKYTDTARPVNLDPASLNAAAANGTTPAGGAANNGTTTPAPGDKQAANSAASVTVTNAMAAAAVGVLAAGFAAW